MQEANMNRRNFIKGVMITTAAVASGKAFAGGYGSESKKRMNMLADRANPSVSEQKHVPGIKAPNSTAVNEWFNVSINVGFMKEHPSTSGHWITMIKLLVNGKEAGRTEFKTGGTSAPEATFRIRLNKTAKVEAVEHCNLHGTWISDPVNIMVS
jgi:superoxide reductase